MTWFVLNHVTGTAADGIGDIGPTNTRRFLRLWPPVPVVDRRIDWPPDLLTDPSEHFEVAKSGYIAAINRRLFGLD